MVAKELMGMICPDCDSRVQQVPDNRCCPNCGGPLGACAADETEETHGFPEPPLGVYSGIQAWMEVGESSVRIKTKVGFSQMSDYTLRYNELTGVVFQPAGNGYAGFLSLRCGLNQDTPFPSELKNAALDVTTIRFYQSSEAAFEKMYAFLKRCVDTVKKEPKTKKMSFALKFPIPPIGVYKGYCGSMEIKNDAVCFTRKFPLNPRSCYTIAYDKLVAVDYVEPGTWQDGRLRVRCLENRNMGFTQAAADQETSIQFIWDRQGKFRYAYEFLKECARIANEEREK